VLALGVSATAWDPVTAASRTAEPVTAGLEQSWVSAQGTWAVVAMGHLDQPLNTFWQVLFRPAGGARWTLVTPPGVASNGGFSADGVPGATAAARTVTAGFEPSKYLRYSPIARTSDDGKKWSVGTLSSELSPVADAIADGADGEVFALVRQKGGSLLRSDGSLTAWRTVVTRRALGATGAGRACGVEALTAVVDPAGPKASLEVGAACTDPGVVGLFHEQSGGWVATSVRVPDDLRSTFTVLRLESGAAGTSAIAEARRAGSAWLVCLWRSGPGAPWTPSSPVRLRGTVVSTAEGAGTSILVVTGHGLRATGLLWIGGPGSAWRTLGSPPSGTQSVAPAPGATAQSAAGGPGALSALAVSGSHVTVWERPVTGGWRPTSQRFTVPIEYGSST
jgi:hypothetical protein